MGEGDVECREGGYCVFSASWVARRYQYLVPCRRLVGSDVSLLVWVFWLMVSNGYQGSKVESEGIGRLFHAGGRVFKR